MKKKLISAICLLSLSFNSFAGVGLLLTGFGISFIDNNAELKRKQKEQREGVERHFLDPRISRWDAFSFGVAAAGIIVGGTGLLAKESAMIILNEDQKDLSQLFVEQYGFINNDLVLEIQDRILGKVKTGDFRKLSAEAIDVNFSSAEIESILDSTPHNLNQEEIKQLNQFLK